MSAGGKGGGDCPVDDDEIDIEELITKNQRLRDELESLKRHCARLESQIVDKDTMYARLEGRMEDRDLIVSTLKQLVEAQNRITVHTIAMLTTKVNENTQMLKNLIDRHQ